MPLTAKDVAEITRLLEESDFLELRLEHEGFKLTLKRAGAPRAGADSATAALGASAPLAMDVAIALPVSWKPLVKSKASAVITTIMRRNKSMFTAPDSRS